MADVWACPAGVDMQADITGYAVRATDGGIGTIDEALNETACSYIVVDTGPWIFGQKVLLPAAAIDQLDHEEEVVAVRLTKDQIKAAPTFDETQERDAPYRAPFGHYYGGLLGHEPSHS